MKGCQNPKACKQSQDGTITNIHVGDIMEGPVCPTSTKLNKLLPYKTNTQTDTQYDYHTRRG